MEKKEEKMEKKYYEDIKGEEDDKGRITRCEEGRR